METLNDLGISISVFNGAGKQLNEATKYGYDVDRFPSVVDSAIATAQTEAEGEPDAADVSVSVLVLEVWIEVWSATFNHEAQGWSWQI